MRALLPLLLASLPAAAAAENRLVEVRVRPAGETAVVEVVGTEPPTFTTWMRDGRLVIELDGASWLGEPPGRAGAGPVLGVRGERVGARARLLVEMEAGAEARLAAAGTTLRLEVAPGLAAAFGRAASGGGRPMAAEAVVAVADAPSALPRAPSETGALRAEARKDAAAGPALGGEVRDEANASARAETKGGAAVEGAASETGLAAAEPEREHPAPPSAERVVVRDPTRSAERTGPEREAFVADEVAGQLTALAPERTEARPRGMRLAAVATERGAPGAEAKAGAKSAGKPGPLGTAQPAAEGTPPMRGAEPNPPEAPGEQQRPFAERAFASEATPAGSDGAERLVSAARREGARDASPAAERMVAEQGGGAREAEVAAKRAARRDPGPAAERTEPAHELVAAERAAAGETKPAGSPAARDLSVAERGAGREAAHGDLRSGERSVAGRGADRAVVAPAAAFEPARPTAAPRASHLAASGRQELTHLGFQPVAGGAKVVIRTAAPPAYRLVQAPGKLVIVLERARIPLANNRRAIDASFFGTAVGLVQPVEDLRRDEVRIEIGLRRKAPSFRIHAEGTELAVVVGG